MTFRWFFVWLGFLAGSSQLEAQRSESIREWLFLSERVAPLSRSASALGISERALWRRSKVLPPDRIIDERDFPVSSAHLEQIRATGATIRSVSRWFNAVSVEATREQRQSLSQLPFIVTRQPVVSFHKRPVELTPLPPRNSNLQLEKGAGPFALDYGLSFTQLNNIKVVDVHALGINASGVIIGMIDNGFNNHRSHAALKNIHILDEYDFIHRVQTTQRHTWEPASQGNHGQYTLSALAGFHNGNLIGPAFGASLILAKTEMDSVEIPAEEDLYVEALEWMEMLGADVVSTSLGYIDWYTYDSLDGRTAITSKAASVLASKGVLLVTAMGNEFWFQSDKVTTGTLIAPADADSIVAVGATFSDGELAGFSSTGPTFDGRTKPEVVAQGVSVVSATGVGSAYGGVSGTSLSTPLVAGVAGLILSARPDLTPMQVREALLQTAVQVNQPPQMSVWPNNYFGWGFVNALDAVLHHGLVFSNRPNVVEGSSSLMISTYIRSNTTLVNDSLFLYYQSGAGAPFARVPFSSTSTPYLYSATIAAGSDTNYPRGYFSARDIGGVERRHPVNAPDSLMNFRSSIYTGVPGFPEPARSYALYPNFPNPFNGTTTIIFDSPSQQPVELTVYNLLGQSINTIFAGVPHVGRNSHSWDGTDHSGRSVATGVYIYRLKTEGSVLSKKLLYLK